MKDMYLITIVEKLELLLKFQEDILMFMVLGLKWIFLIHFWIIMKKIGIIVLSGLLLSFGVAVMTFAHFGEPSLFSQSERAKLAAAKQYHAQHKERTVSDVFTR